MRMNKTVLIASSLLLLGCPGDDSSDDTMATATMTASSTAGTGTTTEDPMTDTSADSSGSDESGAACPDDSLTHAADVQPIWDMHCVTGCHESGGSWPATDLTDGHAGLVDAAGVGPQSSNVEDMQLVTPGNPELSYVLYKLRGTQGDVFEDPAMGLQSMPIEDDGMGGYNELPSIPAADIQTVEDWILCGAPE